VLQADFLSALAEADRVLLGAVSRADKLKADDRFDAEAVAAGIQSAGRTAQAFLTNADLLAALDARVAAAKSPQLVVFFSNGSFDGVIAKFAAGQRKS
jgi:UDP-N-acetylmuramate: L-alanyl-gamma-D-glutamyl-meso-diaminopimelate ligase